MSDVSAPGSQVPAGWPRREFPVLFADGVTSTAWGPGIVKFYFFRSDPEFRATPNAGTNETPTTQVVMPVAGFVATAILFEQTVQRLIEQNAITQDDVDRARAIYTAARHAS
jgi:hypothetical protein